MTVDQQKELELFLAALELGTPEERRVYIRSASEGDNELYHRVLSLMDSHDQSLGPLDVSPPEIDATRGLDQPHNFVGQQIGPYKLLEVIGEGGMGTVYMAEQTEPVHRRVALKLIKTGMDTRQVVARFEAERQTLAVMDHPNIAKVLDAGSTESGRPYFVMELVKGIPITKFCDEQQLDTESRLRLFQQVCQGMQHAHQKGIIHRDIKPSNVLVAMYDDRPVPKVIDFGVAKATAEKLTEKTMFTRFGQIVGTLEYMSPEQAQFNQLDVDTRSDIYSLGAVLYELLAGEPPFDREKMKQQALDETLRMIREDEPTKPSTKLSAIDGLPQIASSRKSTAEKLSLLLRGELDWIVMKAIEKDRSRRYQTSNDLVADINHYLEGEAVVAHPPSRSYRLKKFFRKYKGPVLAATLIGVSLLAGIIGTLIGLFRAESHRQTAEGQRDRAVTAENQASARADQLKKQSDMLKTQTNELKLIADFQAGILKRIDATEAGKRLTQDVTEKLKVALTNSELSESDRKQQIEEFITAWNRVNATDAARELIDLTILKPAVAAIDEQFENQPRINAQLRESLAHRYLELGRADQALRLLKQVAPKYEQALGADHRKTLNAINNIGISLARSGKLKEAEQYIREALEKKRRFLGDDDPDTHKSINNMGLVLNLQDRYAEAELYYREALKKQRADLGDDDPITIYTINNLGILLQDQNKLSEAESLTREALATKRRVFGENHRLTLQSILNLGSLLADQGKLNEAEPYIREAFEKFPRVFGEEHPTTLIAITTMAQFFERQNKLAEAEPFYRDALEKRRRVQGEEHPDTLGAILDLGVLLWRQGKLNEAEPYYRELLEKAPRVFGEEHRTTLIAISNMCRLLIDQRKLDEAEPLTRESLEKRRRVLGKDHPDTLTSLINLAALLQAQGKNAESVELLNPFRERISQAVTGKNAWQYLETLKILGDAYTGLGEFAAAEKKLFEAEQISVQELGPSHKGTIKCMQAIVDLYTAWDKAEPGKGFGDKAAEWQHKLQAVLQSTADDDSVNEIEQ